MAEYIERETLMRKIHAKPEAEGNKRAAQLLEYILSAPAADVAPVVHGRWKLFRAEDWTTVYECSVCKRRVSVSGDKEKADERVMKRYPYCNCGARMNDA